jgi:hypothetical protein
MSRNLELARIELTLMLSHIIVATASRREMVEDATVVVVAVRDMIEDATVVAVAVKELIVHREAIPLTNTSCFTAEANITTGLLQEKSFPVCL